MTSTITLLRQLEALVQEEIGAQSRLQALLERQDEALRTHVPERMLSAAHALDGELAPSAQRAQRRVEIVAALARAWGIAPSALTLSSIVRRSGDEGERLARQKPELERIARGVQKLARRSAIAARYHQRLTAEVVQAVLVQADGVRVLDGGALVDAEA